MALPACLGQDRSPTEASIFLCTQGRGWSTIYTLGSDEPIPHWWQVVNCHEKICWTDISLHTGLAAACCKWTPFAHKKEHLRRKDDKTNATYLLLHGLQPELHAEQTLCPQCNANKTVHKKYKTQYPLQCNIKRFITMSSLHRILILNIWKWEKMEVKTEKKKKNQQSWWIIRCKEKSSGNSVEAI
jgi:hypothetical protein